jgi:hypothetical protein
VRGPRFCALPYRRTMNTMANDIRRTCPLFASWRYMPTALAIVCICGGCGQKQEAPAVREERLVRPPIATPAECRKMVEALVDHNPQPVMAGPGRRTPIFAEKFDWAEYNRANTAMETLWTHAEEAWPELVAHLNDKRYCTTIECEEGGANFSVGNICAQVIRRCLSDSYADRLFLILDHVAAPELAYPWFEYAYPDNLEEWCKAREGKHLSELQSEACQWALAEATRRYLSKRSNDTEWLDSFKEEYAKFEHEVRTRMKELDGTKKAIRGPTFGLGTNESALCYDPRRAEELRNRAEVNSSPNAPSPRPSPGGRGGPSNGTPAP